MTVCPEEESILMTSFVDTLARLQGKEGVLLDKYTCTCTLCKYILSVQLMKELTLISKDSDWIGSGSRLCAVYTRHH